MGGKGSGGAREGAGRPRVTGDPTTAALTRGIKSLERFDRDQRRAIKSARLAAASLARALDAYHHAELGAVVNVDARAALSALHAQCAAVVAQTADVCAPVGQEEAGGS